MEKVSNHLDNLPGNMCYIFSHKSLYHEIGHLPKEQVLTQKDVFDAGITECNSLGYAMPKVRPEKKMAPFWPGILC